MSSNRNMKTEWFTYTLDYSSGSGGGIRMGECEPMWASNKQLVGRRETSPEGRGFPEVLDSSGDMGQPGAPVMKPQQHWAQKSPDSISNSDTVFYKGTRE